MLLRKVSKEKGLKIIILRLKSTISRSFSRTIRFLLKSDCTRSAEYNDKLRNYAIFDDLKRALSDSNRVSESREAYSFEQTFLGNCRRSQIRQFYSARNRNFNKQRDYLAECIPRTPRGSCAK